MRNFKSIGSYYKLIKNSSLNVPLTSRQCISTCYNSSIVNKNIENQTSTLQNRNLFLQKGTYISINLCIRNLSLSSTLCAKGKDRGGKEKKKPKAAKLDLREVSEFFDVDELTGDMNQAIENMKTDFIKNLTLRSTSGALDQLPVKIDKKEYQLQELAQIAKKPKLIVLNVAAFPTAIPHIIKAIEASGLNINPQQDGTTLFLPIPKVTKDHRESLSKSAKAIHIKYRDQIKDIRNKAVKNLKKRKDVSEDTIHRVLAQIETLCDKYVKEAEMILETKQNELLKSD